MYNRQLNPAITVQSCILLLSFATINYYLTPLIFVMSFLDYDNDFSSRFVLCTNEPESSSGVRIKSESSSSNVQIKSEPGHESNDDRPVVNLKYQIMPNMVRGTHVAIYDSLQPSGERLQGLFGSYLRNTIQPPTGRVVINGVEHTYIKKYITPDSNLHKETTLPNSNDRGIWAKAYRENHWASIEYDVRSGNRDLIISFPERKMFIRQ